VKSDDRNRTRLKEVRFRTLEQDREKRFQSAGEVKPEFDLPRTVAGTDAEALRQGPADKWPGHPLVVQPGASPPCSRYRPPTGPR
jgi:hypothetical protein